MHETGRKTIKTSNQKGQSAKKFSMQQELKYNFKFLGMHVTSDGDDNFHIDKRKALAIKAQRN